jgi:hypothetical protein
MRGHMNAVGNQGHRSEQEAAYDLRDHHAGTDCNYSPSFPLVAFVGFTKEIMSVSELFNRMGVHREPR